MPTYVVESYLPRSRGGELDAMAGRARRAATDVSQEGMPVSYVRSIFVSADETCLHFFEAETPRAAREACARSGLIVDRIAEATSTEPPIHPTVHRRHEMPVPSDKPTPDREGSVP